MSSRRVTLFVLCEDAQHVAFANRFLERIGWEGIIRFSISPKADGSAEQWVRIRFPEELKNYRQRASKAANALLAVIDADEKSIQNRISEFESECRVQQVPFRDRGEAVAFAIPKRNIETWIYYLTGELVDDTTAYPKLERPRECRNAVEKLVDVCKTNSLPKTAPLSLITACDEYKSRLEPMMKG